MKNTNQKRGFTLIELLVVIVILGILSTISVGTFRSYFSKARDSERVSAVQNIAMMIKVDSGGDGTQLVYRYGEDGTNAGDPGTCISAESTGGAADDIGDICVPLSDLLAENDFNMPAVKNGMLYNYCFQPGAVEGNNDFVIAAQAEEADAPNGTVVGSISVFADGTMDGVAAATDETTLTWANGDLTAAGGNWVCGQIGAAGALTID